MDAGANCLYEDLRNTRRDSCQGILQVRYPDASVPKASKASLQFIQIN